MRILFLNLYYRPDMAATAQMLSDLAEHLAAAGHDVEVSCSAGSYDGVERGLPARDEINGVRVRRWPSPRLGRRRIRHRLIEYGAFVAGSMFGLLFGARRDVVVTLTTPPLLELIGQIGAWRGAKFVSWQMDVYPEIAEVESIFPAGGMISRLWRAKSAFALRRASAVVALSGGMASALAEGRRGLRSVSESAAATAAPIDPCDQLSSATNSPSRRTVPVIAIPNWTDDDAIQPPGEAGAAADSDAGARFRQRHDIPAGRPILLYSGNMGRLHPTGALIAAIRRLYADPAAPRWLFVFVGGGRRRAELTPLADELGPDHIRLLPYQPRELLAESLAAADLHLVTLKAEAARLLVPSKIYGMLASGRPVVSIVERGDAPTSASISGASASTPVADAEHADEIGRILADSGAGWAATNADELVTILRDGAADAAERARRGAAGRAWLDANASRAASLRAWRLLLESITRDA